MSGVRVEVARGDRVESVHHVDVAVVGTDGMLVAGAGDVEGTIFARSSLKPFQAVPLVEDGVLERFGLSDQELALACASHSGEPRHVEVARSILAKLGLEEAALQCGPHAPFSSQAARAIDRAGDEPGRIHNNCSGKHAGMLAMALAGDWSLEDYHRWEHPVQQRMLREVARWTDVAEDGIETAVDGCGVLTFAVPLRSLALAFARLADATSASPPGRVREAMTRHPFLVGGTNRLCTRIMEVSDGRILAKVGAEGVYGALDQDRGVGIGLKVRDGARRGAEVALVGVLESLGLLEAREVESLERWRRPAVENTRGERVGELRAVVALEGAHG